MLCTGDPRYSQSSYRVLAVQKIDILKRMYRFIVDLFLSYDSGFLYLRSEIWRTLTDTAKNEGNLHFFLNVTQFISFKTQLEENIRFLNLALAKSHFFQMYLQGIFFDNYFFSFTCDQEDPMRMLRPWGCSAILLCLEKIKPDLLPECNAWHCPGLDGTRRGWVWQKCCDFPEKILIRL